jgi:hypothetical protein
MVLGRLSNCLPVIMLISNFEEILKGSPIEATLVEECICQP